MRPRLVWAIGLVLLACATAASAIPSASRAPATVLRATACLGPADSTHVSISWAPVMDRRGQPVAAYVWNLRRNGSVIAGDTTTETRVTGSLPCPQFGDSVAISSQVQAIDVRGNAGAVGTSNTIIIRTADPGPVAPVITIDTIAAVVDSITFVGGFALNDGTSAPLCTVRVWVGGRAYVPNDLAPLCVPAIQPAGLGLLRYPSAVGD